MPRRNNDELRPITITPHYLAHPEGSALIACGDTKVICTASVEDRVPPWMSGRGRGWVTGEYDMLPRSTNTRSQRDSQRGKPSGRSQEISRLVGRALRAVTDLTGFGERTITVDCDVIQADGGTRTAAITGAYVALYQAMKTMAGIGLLSAIPLKDAVAATSVGVYYNTRLLDLCYDEDYNAEVDFNVVMTGQGKFVEVQGTAEGKPFPKETIDSLLALAEKGIKELFQAQQAVIDTLKKG